MSWSVRSNPPRRPRRSTHLGGFSLVELLVVIGIITLLAGILLPFLLKARRNADRIRTAGDLQTISQALENFKQTAGDYPTVSWPAANTIYDANNNPLAAKTSGPSVLYFALCQGFKVRQGGTTYGPFIDPEKFNTTSSRLNDRNGTPILYFPALVQPAPDLSTSTTPQRPIVANGGTPTPLYNYAASTGLGLALADMQKIMGVRAGSAGKLASTDTPTYTGPFLLWAAGPDKLFTLDASGKTDDVTNFEIPSDLRR